MRDQGWRRSAWWGRGVVGLSFLLAAPLLLHGQEPMPGVSSRVISGEELFRREWIPNDPRSHGGDGLGPVFNDTSCVACHNQGGAGGAGAAAKNVALLSVVSDQPRGFGVDLLELRQIIVDFVTSAASSPERVNQREQRRQAVLNIHPGLATTPSVVLHRFATDPDYENWQDGVLFGEHLSPKLPEEAPAHLPMSDDFSVSPSDSPPASHSEADDPMRRAARRFLRPKMRIDLSLALDKALQTALAEPDWIQNRRELVLVQRFGLLSFKNSHEDVAVITSERNPTAIFGAALIDSIPAAAIEAGAARRDPAFPLVAGRTSRLADGRIGRFGWKGQIATLRDFTMTACAVELGLHVPEHPQSPLPNRPDAAPPGGFDLSTEECEALVRYLRELPAPAEKRPDHRLVAEWVDTGRKLFEQVGCALCHVPKLGDVEGLYSDLLLHDLGNALSDSARYGGTPSDAIDLSAETDDSHADEGLVADGRRSAPARSREWRTPPLWGVADSAPYLHDGRAATLEGAIVFHGGEAHRSNVLFHTLKPVDRAKVIAFLKTLGVPRD